MIGCVVPWFGTSRSKSAQIVGRFLDGCSWVGIPFSGGASEVMYIKARQISINDLHGHIINLCRVIACPEDGAKLYSRLTAANVLFHPALLEDARDAMLSADPVERAFGYFVQSWMSRSAQAGTNAEDRGSISSRFTATGGGSAVRFWSAVKSISEWHMILQRVCEFTVLDFRKLITKYADKDTHGIYADPPWLDLGKNYKHPFTESDHIALADWLNGMRECRIVVRHSDCPLYRSLYPRSAGWKWKRADSVNQAGNAVAEVLICRRIPDSLWD